MHVLTLSYFKMTLTATVFMLSMTNILAQQSTNNDFQIDDLQANNAVVSSVVPEKARVANEENDANKKIDTAPAKEAVKEVKSVVTIARVEGFNAFAADRYIRLNWTVTSERNCKKLILERRSDSNQNFEAIDYVVGRGTIYEKANFYLMDYSSQPGTQYYYRLKILNEAGEYQLSNVISGKR